MAFNKTVHVFSVQQLENEWERYITLRTRADESFLFFNWCYFISLLGSKGFLKSKVNFLCFFWSLDLLLLFHYTLKKITNTQIKIFNTPLLQKKKKIQKTKPQNKPPPQQTQTLNSEIRLEFESDKSSGM